MTPDRPGGFFDNLDDVTRWLRNGLCDYLENEKGPWSFRPFEHRICTTCTTDDLAGDLHAVYRDLPSNAQRLWGVAIRDILAKQRLDPTKIASAEVLIDLASLIRAIEVLDVLPTLLFTGDHLLHYVVRAAVALADRTKASETCLDRIRVSPCFSPDYAGLVLQALCHANPDDWSRHVENLDGHMTILAGRLDTKSTALGFYARNILSAVGLARLRSADLNRLDINGAATWLLAEWFGGPDPLIRHDFSAKLGHRLRLQEDASVFVGLDGPLSNGWHSRYRETVSPVYLTRMDWHYASDTPPDEGELVQTITKFDLFVPAVFTEKGWIAHYGGEPLTTVKSWRRFSHDEFRPYIPASTTTGAHYR